MIATLTTAAAAGEVSATISALGAIGLLSMLVFRFALKAYDYDYLPVALAARVRWWDRHHAVVLGISAGVLVVGLTGLVLEF